MADCGVTVKKPPGNRTLMLAYAMMCYHRGPHPDDMLRAGVPPEIGPMELEVYLNSLDTITNFPGDIYICIYTPYNLPLNYRILNLA